MIVISHFQARKIFYAWKLGKKFVESSFDLGKTKERIEIKDDFAIGSKGKININILKEIIKDKRSVYLINKEIYKVQFFSEETGKFYKLVPTGEFTPPTLEISGIHMHRIKGIDPLTDTLSKLKLIKEYKDKVILDSCTGLGYSAIYSIKLGAREVITVEKDKNVIEIAKYNPWSEELFKDERIKLYIEDVVKKVKEFEDEYFDIIIHDPPRFTYRTSYLYSRNLYKEFYRVLKEGGEIIHYIGKPRYISGFKLYKNVMKKLTEIGFKDIKFDKNTLCVYAKKL